MSPTHEIFERLVTYGYRPLACIGKRPRRVGWQSGDIDAERAILQPGDNIGLACGFDGLTALDFDISNPELAESIMVLPELCGLPVRIGRAPRFLMPFRSPLPAPSRDWQYAGLPPGDKVQVIGKGRQFIAYGTHPDTGFLYTWPRSLPPLNQLPVHEVEPV
jgi:hypothetical protein